MLKGQFVNKSRDAIKETLEGIGKVRFEEILKNARLEKPKKLANFKLVWTGLNCALTYKYPGEFGYQKICILKEYEMPSKGWEWEMYKG